MSSISINGEPVLSLDMSLPISGPWSANIQVAASEALAVGAAAFLSLPGQGFEAVVKQSGVFADRAHLRVTGGLQSWDTQLEPKHYQNTTVSTVLEDMGVETDQPVSDSLAFWSRQTGTLAQAVQALAEHLGVNWRVNPDGTVRMRAEEPTAVNPDAIELERDAARGMVVLAPEKAIVLPGTMVGQDVVESVIYTSGQSGFRCRYTTSGKQGFREAIQRLIRWVTRDALYLGTYLCEVSRQAADGTLDLMPFDQRIRSNGLQGVPIRHGIAGVASVEVPAGQLVMLAFDQGSPSRPYAALFNGGKVNKYVLDIDSLEVGGTVAVALATLVKAELDKLQSSFDSHTHLYTPGPGAPVPTATPLPLVGTILDVASSKLKTE